MCSDTGKPRVHGEGFLEEVTSEMSLKQEEVNPMEKEGTRGRGTGMSKGMEKTKVARHGW